MPDPETPSDPMLSYEPPKLRRRSILASVSLALGIAAFPLNAFFFAGVPVAIGGLIAGFIALRQIRVTRKCRGNNVALAGIIVNALALMVAIGCGIMVFSTPFAAPAGLY
jgi:hypothetical protein